MEKFELTMLQALPLDVKILKTKQRIREFIDHMGGEDKVYISFSGGKDSTVLLDIVRQEYPTIEAVFSNTGLEFPELVKFAMTKENVTMVRPNKSFKQVIEEYGYPMISKKTARMISDCQNPTPNNVRSRQLYLSDYILDADGNPKDKKNCSFRLANKWRYLINAPFKISHKCCNELKKKPLRKWEKEHGKKPIIGTMAEESRMREGAYLQTGCNSFTEGHENCTPMGFWTEQDVLEYIYTYNLDYAPVYGDLIMTQDKQGKYIFKFTGEQRTGCIFCGFGKDEKQLSERYLRLEETHPQLHKYCMDKLGFKNVCEYMGIKYSKDIDVVKKNDGSKY